MGLNTCKCGRYKTWTKKKCHTCLQVDDAEDNLLKAITLLREVTDIASSIHQTAPPDYAWSECADCGTEDGKHSDDCVIKQAEIFLSETTRAD